MLVAQAFQGDRSFLHDRLSVTMRKLSPRFSMYGVASPVSIVGRRRFDVPATCPWAKPQESPTERCEKKKGLRLLDVNPYPEMCRRADSNLHSLTGTSS